MNFLTSLFSSFMPSGGGAPSAGPERQAPAGDPPAQIVSDRNPPRDEGVMNMSAKPEGLDESPAPQTKPELPSSPKSSAPGAADDQSGLFMNAVNGILGAFKKGPEDLFQALIKQKPELAEGIVKATLDKVSSVGLPSGAGQQPGQPAPAIVI